MTTINFSGAVQFSRQITGRPTPRVKGCTMNYELNRTARPSILVVEDFQPLRSSVVQWLQVRFPGCIVQGVDSGERALEHASNARPDVVLMDISLPGIDGLEAAQRLKAQAPDTAVVMLTTYDTPSHRRAAANAGAAGYVAKHDMETQLESTVQHLLGPDARRSS
jgi:DNA-binding NarL/FixJ family response regulator